MRVVFALLALLVSVAQASTSNGIVTVTSPANGSSDADPVTVTASATTPPTCAAGVAAMGIYPTPGNLLYTTSGSSLNKSFDLTPGSYPDFVVQEWDKCGGASKVALNIAVTSSSQIVTVTSPANGSTDTDPVTVTASATTPPTCSAGVAAMGIYPTPGNLLFTTSGNSINQSFNLTPGSYPDFVVQEWDKCGGASKVALSITVTASSSIVTVTSPANNSTNTDPVTVTASASTPPTCSAGVAAMGIYPTPGNLLFTNSGSSINQSFNLTPGSYPDFVVQEWDKCGGASKVALNITVTGSTAKPPAVLTWGYSPSRNNVNTKETVLTPGNVNSTKFGKKFSYSVDGIIYGQPLFVPGLNINGATHNVVYVATENNSVYAFDADGKGQLWKKSFGSPVPCGNALVSGCGVAPNVGISATPVIDTGRGNIYVENRQYNSSTGTYSHSLHSLKLTSGAESSGSPVSITAKVSGTGYDAVNGTITFNQQTENSRGALLQLNGTIYIVYSQPGDTDPYHGWILGYNADTLAQSVVFNDTPGGQRGGIWSAEAGPASDGTNIFVATANGTWDGNENWGTSYVKLSPIPNPGTLTELDYFTPFNQATLNANDRDLGSAGINLLPTFGSSTFPHILIGAGKEGRIYVINRDGMGHFDSTCDCQIIQSIPNAVGVAANNTDLMRNFMTPPYWNGNVYFAGSNDHIRRFHLSTTTSKLNTSPSDMTGTIYARPGPNVVVSANGNSNGILWAVARSTNVLHAYDALHLTTELYNSSQNSTRDALGSSVKFAAPLVVNGKVYVGTGSKLIIYGLL